MNGALLLAGSHGDSVTRGPVDTTTLGRIASSSGSLAQFRKRAVPPFRGG